MIKRRWLKTALAVVGFAALAGCSTLQQLPVEVRSFGQWPAGRAPGSYAFDRLPSQQASASGVQQALESAAGEALQAAGFKPAASGETPDVLVQLGARVNRADLSPWDDPLWWRGGFGVWRPIPWRGPSWSLRAPGLYSPRYDRQVALLIRDRQSGEPLYEVHASSEGYSESVAGLLAPMLRAALTGFPAVQPQPTLVRVPY